MTGDQARKEAWLALADLFLDTTVDERAIARIASQLRRTGLPLDELERLYEREVAPACWRNLATVPGGEWLGFDAESLVRTIEQKRLHAPDLSWWDRWRISRWTASTRDDWLRVKRVLQGEDAENVR
ncbi:DUF7079 family protein [Eleftheria terrae]|uniref:DUF7079 family protein n=1 Tax=Eleftheria terrae TaxID=1597781 RepID=UPI00263B5A04|nr:hypothetical protein [Eleftheria terrae]WKB56186.1 hypothetical protein N7L95_29540 [Eleftheria terrae]